MRQSIDRPVAAGGAGRAEMRGGFFEGARLRRIRGSAACAIYALCFGMAADALAASAPVYQLDIPAQDVRSALQALGNAASTQILFSGDAVAGRRSTAVKGPYTADAAVALMLEGSGLQANETSAGVLLIRPKGANAAPGESAAGSEQPFRLAQSDPQRAAGGSQAEPRSAPGQEQGADGPKVEEIIVTAQKRSQNLQKVPISVQVIDNQALVKQNNNALADLSKTVPGVHVSTDSLASTLSIRGIGSIGNASFDQSVAMFTDDIYHGRSRMSGATFLDLDRIEVLKGPQSTFFGNNAIAGALNIVTKKPGGSFDAWVRALYGQFDEYAVEGAIGGPLSDKFGARLAVTANGVRNGWVENTNTGEHVPRTENEAARLTLDFHPNDEWDATLKIEGGRQKTTGTFSESPVQWADCPPPPPLLPFNVGLGGGCALAIPLGVPMGGDKTSGLAGQGNNLTTFENVLTVNYHKWDHTFTSVTGYYNYRFNQRVDVANLPIAEVTSEFPERYHQFSQELRVASPTDVPVEYLAGAYFQTGRVNWNREGNFPLFNVIFAPPPPAPQLLPSIFLPFAANQGFSQDEQVYSIFGSVTWNVTDRLKLIAGLRGSWDEKSTTAFTHYGTATQLYGGFAQLPALLEPFGSFLLGPPGESPNLHKSSQDWMPSAAVQYQFQPEIMGYFSYKQGFKAAGINGEQQLNTPGLAIYEPEFVNAYEIGMKSKWLHDRILFNIALFRSDYSGLQVDSGLFNPATNTFIEVVKNAAASRSQGVEIETGFVVTRDLRINANVSYLDAYYISYPDASPTQVQAIQGQQTQDLSGRPTSYAPKWSGNVAVSYSIPISADYKITTELASYFTTGFFAGSAGSDDPFSFISGYARLDGRLALESQDGRWTLELIGKNLTDRVIWTQRTLGSAYRDRPRDIAVQFRYQWK